MKTKKFAFENKVQQGMGTADDLMPLGNFLFFRFVGVKGIDKDGLESAVGFGFTKNRPIGGDPFRNRRVGSRRGFGRLRHFALSPAMAGKNETIFLQ